MVGWQVRALAGADVDQPAAEAVARLVDLVRALGTHGVVIRRFVSVLLGRLGAWVQRVGPFALGIQLLTRGVEVLAVPRGTVLQAGGLGGLDLGFRLSGARLCLRLGGDGLALVQPFAPFLHVFPDAQTGATYLT